MIRRLCQLPLLGLLKFLLWTRYRVKLTGLDALRKVDKPLLVLCNHPGFTDPLIVYSRLLWPLNARPLLFAENFPGPLAVLPWVTNAITVPQLTGLDSEAGESASRAVSAVADGLNNGLSFILWPAGQLYRAGHERLRSQSGASAILSQAPDAQLALLRTRGLWGSRFSWAFWGEAPPLVPQLFKTALLVLLSLVFFLPRRTIEIEIELIDREQLPQPIARDSLNRWLEGWFNKPGSEEPRFVPYHWLGSRSYDYPEIVEHEEVDVSGIDDEVKQRTRELLAEHLPELPAEPLEADHSLEILGLDSIERMALTAEAQQRFGVEASSVPHTVGQLWRIVAGLERGELEAVVPEAWRKAPAPVGEVEPLGETLPEAFVRRARRDRAQMAVVDDLSGALSYGRLLIGVTLFARRVRRLPSPSVGVMLPAAAACDMAILAVSLAGKLPVLLNWTTGSTNLAHACELMGLTHVLSSQAFLEKAAIELPDGLELLDLGELKAGIGTFEALRTALALRLGIGPPLPAISPDDPAVVLFTSGSERAPKAVPLTHRNLIQNMRFSQAALALDKQDVMLGFLPPFHSFGLVITSLLPLLGGMRVVHHADPTDAGALARKIGAFGCTLACGTPTFMRYLLGRAAPGELDTLRLAAVGAEAAPPALFELCRQKAPDAEMLEGYGITECSPVVAVNPPGGSRPGTIGQPLPGLEVIVVDAEQDAATAPELPTGERGRVLVHGDSVFPGYLGDDVPDPFVDRDGKRWYDTGDLAAFDEDRFLHFKGRLKRFLKSGGEMISLPALEQPLVERWPASEEGPRVAVEGVEAENGCTLVVFATEPLELGEVNRTLTDAGFPALMRIDRVEHLDEIPVLGTGKTDYKALRKRLVEQAPDPAGAPA